jgi:hypothetical protein
MKAPMLPLEISADDPISGNATLKLGKAQKKFPVTNIVILLLLIAFGLVAYFAIGNMKAKKRGDVVQNTELTNEQELPSTAAAPADKPAASDAATVTAPVLANDSLSFILRATDSVWVSIGSDDGVPYRGKLMAGETKNFRAAERFVVNIGNQKALEMTFNGTRLSNLPTIKNSGMVVRNLVLTKDHVSLNGTDVNTSNAPGSPDAPTTTATTSVVPKTVAPSTSVKTAATTPKPAATTSVKKPTTSTTLKSATTTSSTVKKPLTSTTTPLKKPVRKPAVKPNVIPSVDPKPAAAD